MNSETLYGRNRVECLLTIPFSDQIVFREKGYVIFFLSPCICLYMESNLTLNGCMDQNIYRLKRA